MFPSPQNKSAQTRFKNDQQIAASASLTSQVNPRQSGFNLQQKSRLNVPGMSVGTFDQQAPNANSYGTDLNKLLNGLANQQQAPMNPSRIPQNHLPFVQRQNNIESFARDLELQQFLESPQLDQAITRAKLTQYFTSTGLIE